MTFNYDHFGRLEYIIYPDTARTQYNYQYNGMGYLKEVRKQGSSYPYINIADTDYNALGQIKNSHYGNGVNTAYAYYEDGSYRLKDITTTRNGTAIQAIHYEFDDAGNIEAMDVTTHTNAAYTVNHDFTYDSLNRLKTATANCTNDTSRSYNQGYIYDLAGNMTNKTGIGGWDVLTWESDVNRPRIRPKSVRFDAEVAGIAQRNVINNQDQKPVQITYQGNTTNLYYDGAGERIKKVKGAETVVYVGGIYEVRNGQAMSYIYANGQKIVTLANNKEYYTHSDHLGSTGIVTDETGTIVEEIGYLPFGSTLFRNDYNGSTWASAYRFTGQEFDEEYHLYNYNARLYDPIMSRFITPDTIVPNPYNPQSLNRYSYVLNNPLTYIDPSGHQEEEFTYGDFCLYRDMLAHELKMREMYGGGSNTPYSLGFTTGFESWLFLSGTDFWNMGFAEYNNFLRWNSMGGGIGGVAQANGTGAHSDTNKSRDWLDIASDISAGFGDTLTSGFGLTSLLGLPSATEAIRNMWSENIWDGTEGVNYDSASYTIGQASAYAWGAITFGTGGATTLNNGIIINGNRVIQVHKHTLSMEILKDAGYTRKAAGALRNTPLWHANWGETGHFIIRTILGK